MNFGPAPAVVLVNPQLGENIGMAARAMANFSLSDLRLVSPRFGIEMERAVTASAGAVETVEAATTHETLDEALAEFHFVYATTARPREMTKEVMTPEQAAADMHTRIGRGEKVAILFGRERFGLSNEEVSKADVIISAPVNPAYASLNIAQAVLLVGYEWYRPIATTLGMETQELAAHEGPGLKMTNTKPATKTELYGFYDHIEAELADAGFFKSKDKQPIVMRNFRNMFARAGLTEQEVKTLRGMVSSLTRKHLRGRKTDG
ncbi:MAG: RNA methyltransferase [Alphaproteobacteria bacterium]|nr:RNA methyltransferase [Alphaproteobacteria bacterium]